jgi:hypothetical protein
VLFRVVPRAANRARPIWNTIVFIPATAIAILNIVAVAVGACRVVAGAVEDKPDGPGVGEFVCCGWLLLCFWPFVTGLVGKRSYGIPWSVKLKAGLLVAAFVHFCRFT